MFGSLHVRAFDSLLNIHCYVTLAGLVGGYTPNANGERAQQAAEFATEQVRFNYGFVASTRWHHSCASPWMLDAWSSPGATMSRGSACLGLPWPCLPLNLDCIYSTFSASRMDDASCNLVPFSPVQLEEQNGVSDITVRSIDSQVVAGTNYRITLDANLPEVASYTAVVFGACSGRVCLLKIY